MERRQWVACLRTIRAWSRLLGTEYKDQIGLQIGLLDQYVMLIELSTVLQRSIPSWVKERI
jgi:hypothetical protein